MKHTLLYIAAIALLTACQQEEFPQEAQALGYLSIPAVEIKASDIEIISTRAENEEPLVVELLQGEEVKYSAIYADGMTISCAPGSYMLQVRSESYDPGKENINVPLYFHQVKEPVVIEEGKTETIEDPIKVKMINFGVQLQLPEEFDTWFEEYTFTVNGKELKDDETVYFDYSSDTEINYTLTAMNKDGEPFTKESSSTAECWEGKTIAAGTIYIISYAWETQTWKVE